MNPSTSNLPSRISRPSGPFFVLAEKGNAAGQPVDVYLHLDAVEDILHALPRGSRAESGGLLAGHAGEDERGRFVLVRRALPALRARGERISLTFTAEAWDDLWAAQERECPDCEIVGWYHTHPGLGVFLSEPDLFIQRHFFSQASHLALVLDPDDFRWGVFYWQDGNLRAATGLYLYSERARSYPQLEQTLREIAPEWIILHDPD